MLSVVCAQMPCSGMLSRRLRALAGVRLVRGPHFAFFVPLY